MSKDAPVSLPTRLYPHRFTILLAALVVNLLLAPVLVSFSGLQDSAFGGGLSLASLVVLMLAAVLAVTCATQLIFPHHALEHSFIIRRKFIILGRRIIRNYRNARRVGGGAWGQDICRYPGVTWRGS